MERKKGKSRNEKIFDTLNNSRWFMEECEFVRKTYIKKNLDKSYLINETKRICKLLPSYWENSIRKYIESGILVRPKIENAQVVFMQDKNEKTLYIRIFQKTSKEDVTNKKIWKEVKKFQKLLPEIWAPEIESNLTVFRVWEEVMSRTKKPRDIAGEVQSIMNVKYHIDISVSDIRKRISTLKKQLHAYKK